MNYGCIKCAEINVDYTDGDEYSTRLCTCGKKGRVLDMQEAFDYIKALQSTIADLGGEYNEGEEPSDDPQELFLDEFDPNAEIDDWELDD